jgi:AcrR family transcriptional regulator
MTAQHREAALAQSAALAPERLTQTHGAHAEGSTRAPLSCTRIIDAAVRYVDDNCLDELSMRRLGNELGVEAMSLYRYFPSKGALLDAVAGWLLRDLALPEPDAGADWEAQVRAYSRSFRVITQAHPNLMPLLTSMSPSEPPLVDIHGRMVGLWRDAGLSAADAESAQRALQCYLSGSSQWHRTSCAGAHAEADFAFGLEVFLEGFRSRMPARPG